MPSETGSATKSTANQQKPAPAPAVAEAPGAAGAQLASR